MVTITVIIARFWFPSSVVRVMREMKLDPIVSQETALMFVDTDV